MTREGAIPHLPVVTDAGMILAPVKLQPNDAGKVRMSKNGTDMGRYPAPMRRNGRLVFALPGGGEVLG